MSHLVATISLHTCTFHEIPIRIDNKPKKKNIVKWMMGHIELFLSKIKSQFHINVAESEIESKKKAPLYIFIDQLL